LKTVGKLLFGVSSKADLTIRLISFSWKHSIIRFSEIKII